MIGFLIIVIFGYSLEGMKVFPYQHESDVHADYPFLSYEGKELNYVMTSNHFKNNKIRYIYNCEVFKKQKSEKYFSIINNHSEDKYLSYTIFENGMLFRSTCENPQPEKNVDSQAYLRQCAKSLPLNFLDMHREIVNMNENSISSIKWCIVDEQKHSLEILEFINFEKSINTEFQGILNPCYQNESVECDLVLHSR